MNRCRSAMVGTCAAIASVALVLSSPAAAFAADTSWDGDQNVAWSQPANWAGGAVPVAGDALFFPVVGVHGFSDNELANPFVADRLVITGAGVSIAGWPIAIDPAGTVGISITAPDVTITPELRLNGDQTVSVSEAGELRLPSNVRIESGIATFDVDGFLSVGQLDGVGFAGGAVKTGSGILEINGAGGIADGVQVQEGFVHLIGNGAGTAWVLDGGTISGYGEMERLEAIDGRLAPGDDYFGVGIETLEIWNLFTATDDTALALQLQADGSNDSLYTLEGTQIDGAMLELDIEPGTAIGTEWTILEQEREVGPAYFWNFTTPDGTPIVEGEPFTVYGGIFSLETIGRTVVVTYLGEEVIPATPTVPALPATGLDGATAVPGIVIAGGTLVIGALALLFVRRLRRP